MPHASSGRLRHPASLIGNNALRLLQRPACAVSGVVGNKGDVLVTVQGVLRWSLIVRQSGGWVGPGFPQTANPSISLAPHVSSDVRPARMEWGRSALWWPIQLLSLARNSKPGPKACRQAHAYLVSQPRQSPSMNMLSLQPPWCSTPARTASPVSPSPPQRPSTGSPAHGCVGQIDPPDLVWPIGNQIPQRVGKAGYGTAARSR